MLKEVHFWVSDHKSSGVFRSERQWPILTKSHLVVFLYQGMTTKTCPLCIFHVHECLLSLIIFPHGSRKHGADSFYLLRRGCLVSLFVPSPITRPGKAPIGPTFSGDYPWANQQWPDGWGPVRAQQLLWEPCEQSRVENIRLLCAVHLLGKQKQQFTLHRPTLVW